MSPVAFIYAVIELVERFVFFISKISDFEEINICHILVQDHSTVKWCHRIKLLEKLFDFLKKSKKVR